MQYGIAAAIVYLTAILGWRLMRKIQPEDALLYGGYALFICVAYTVFLAVYAAGR